MDENDPLYHWSHTGYDPARTPPDLSTCDQEPVAFITTVQSHGVMLIFSADGDTMWQRSENWRTIWPDEILGKPLDELFSRDECQWIKGCTGQRRIYFNTTCGRLDLSVHRSGSALVVEVEKHADRRSPEEPLLVQAAIARLEVAADVDTFLAILAHEMRSFLRLDRAMIYRFLPDWTGEIVKESCAQGISPRYQGLRFPASDIPAPAREVFRRLWARHIRDVNDTPVALYPSRVDELGALDLSRAVYRAVSPIHLEYLKNMDVRASFTGTLRVDGKLWGLVACHHSHPLEVNLEERSSLELFLELASMRLTSLLAEERQAGRMGVKSIIDGVEEQLKRMDFLRLDGHIQVFRQLIDCDATAVFQGGHWWTDSTLDSETLHLLHRYCRQQMATEQIVSGDSDYPREFAGEYPGVLFLRDQAQEQGYAILWLRKKDPYTIRWAGDPGKVKSGHGAGARLQPRSSFQEYIESVEHRSAPWSEGDHEAARRLGQAIQRVALYLAERSELQKQALQRSNEELEAFAFMASHDLQEPLRGIYTYVEALVDDYSSVLGDGVQLAEHALQLATRMNLLIRDLLHYARLGDRELAMGRVETDLVVRELLAFQYTDYGDQIQVSEPLPPVYGYESFVREIFSNLLSNAIKYSGGNKEIRVGLLAQEESSKWTFFVQDNGIGIHADHHGRIFNLFRRLHPPDQFGGGSGAGLAIVKRMLERHGCHIWLKSAPEAGSTFYFELPKFRLLMQDADPLEGNQATSPDHARPL